MTGASRKPQETGRTRIVYLVHRLGLGGLENAVVNLVNHLEPARFESMIVSFSQPDPLQKRVCAERVRVVTLNKRRGNDPVLVYRLYRLLRRERPGILQTHNWGTLVEGVLAAKLARVPVVVHAERGTVEEGKWNIVVQRLFWGATRQVLCVSEAHRRRLSEAVGFPDRQIKPIPNGVDTAVFYPRAAEKEGLRRRLGLEPNCLYIGAVGNLRPVKNHSLLLRASRDLCRARDDVRLVIVGEGPLREALVRLAEELAIGPKVVFLGARTDIPEILNALDVFVLPSLSEGMPNAVLEAMACGLPVVATRVGGVPEVIDDGKTGILVPSEDATRVTAALERLVGQPELRRALGQAALRHVRTRFSLEAMIREYEALYRSLAAER